MNSKTKIIVLHMKEIIYTAIFIGLAILLICLLFIMFHPKKSETPARSASYIPGIYTSSLTLGSQNGIPLYPTKNILPAFIPLLLHSEMKIWNWKFLSLTPLSIPSAFPI